MEPPAPSKYSYEDKSAHTGEVLGLFVFDVWIAGNESIMLFRNVRPLHQFITQKMKNSVTLLSKDILPMGNRNENSSTSIPYPSIFIC
jgi:hypothetical protein